MADAPQHFALIANIFAHHQAMRGAEICRSILISVEVQPPRTERSGGSARWMVLVRSAPPLRELSRNMLVDQPAEPTADERRRAVCAAMAWAPGLIRYASRFTRSIEDAEDVYQRAMEIALMRAPVTEADEFTAWLHVVIKNEAIAVADAHRRELPVTDDDLEASMTLERSAEIPEPDAVLEWRERYRAIQDAICGLTESQRMCLMLRSAGLSRVEIMSITGYSDRKVHRSIIEGRSRLHAWEIRMAAGEECARAGELIDMTVDNSASRRERRALSRHLHHCHACRSRYRSRRDQVRMLGSMVPAVLVGGEILQNGAPDPSFALAWWERVTSSAGVRTAQVMQVVMDVPAMASTKAGAGAIAAAAAGAIGTPIVIDAVRSERTVPAPTAIVQPATAAPTPSPGGPPIRLTTPFTPPAGRTTPAPRVRTDMTARAGAHVSSAKRAESPSTTYRTTTTRSGVRSSAGRASATLEFGP